MAKASDSPPPKRPPARKIAPRRKTAERRLRILDHLTTGLSVAHIARVERLTVPHVRRLIAQMLGGREIDPPAGFVQLQIARLGEAMVVAHTLMLDGDLRAMDRFIKLTAELDRYHGVGPGQAPAVMQAPRRLAAPAPEPETAEASIFLPASL